MINGPNKTINEELLNKLRANSIKAEVIDEKNEKKTKTKKKIKEKENETQTD